MYLQNVVVGFGPDDGRVLWHHRVSDGYDEHAAWPVYEEPYLLTAAAFRGRATALPLGAGPRFIGCSRNWLRDDAGSFIFLYNAKSGYATRPGGPAACE